MDPLTVIVAGLFGLLVGSFLNVVAARVPRGVSIVSPGSACPACGHAVRPWDNVPVVSWLVLRGRCRDCSASISARYPVVEALTGALWAGAVWRFGLTYEAAVMIVLLSGLVVLSAIDIDYRIIPNKILLPLILLVLAAQLVLAPDRWLEFGLAGLGAAGYLYVAALIKPGGMGMGDVKLALLLGIGLGATVAVAMLIGIIVAALVGIGIVLARGAAGRKVRIPLAPFLSAGAVIAAFWGASIQSSYLGLFG